MMTSNGSKKPHNSNTVYAGKASTKKSCTTILCELTQLKSQQKYLECSQIKLNPQNFNDANEQAATATNAGRSPQKNTVTALLNDIERIKYEQETSLQNHTYEAKREVDNMWIFINALKEELSQPERLRQLPMKAIKERIINVNSNLERMKLKNSKELQRLREYCANMETETNKFLFNNKYGSS